MELKGAIEPTIGPYEVYEDELFNYKAAFESFITVQRRGRDREAAALRAASCRTSRTTCRSIRSIAIRSSARWRRSSSSTRSSRPATRNRGVQTAAFNLPNDERVIREKGAKRVMLKNVQDAKFAKTLVPISKVVLVAGRSEGRSSFDAFFTHILVHELMHGLGPHNIAVERPADDGAAGAEGDLQRARRGEGRHLRRCSPSST